MTVQRIRYKIVVREHNGYTFAYKNNLLEFQLNDHLKAANGSHPDATVTIERETYKQ